jgi:esterase/lipase superfamily enzyme
VREEKFRDLILIAADIDREVFLEALPLLRMHTEKITLLVSRRDRALDVSRVVNRAPRLGQATGLELEGVEVIDVTAIADTHFSGHVYHLRNPAVVDLIREVITRGSD